MERKLFDWTIWGNKPKSSASNVAVAVSWSYDAAGRLTNETSSAGFGAGSVSYALDDSGLAINAFFTVAGSPPVAYLA